MVLTDESSGGIFVNGQAVAKTAAGDAMIKSVVLSDGDRIGLSADHRLFWWSWVPTTCR